MSRMPHIYPHTKSGVFFYKLWVPRELQAVFGKRWVRVNLGIKDRKEAELRSLRIHEETELMFRAARTGLWPPRPEAEIQRLAHEWFDFEFPPSERRYDRMLTATLYNEDDYDPRQDSGGANIAPYDGEAQVASAVADWAKRKGLGLSEHEIKNLAEEAAFLHHQYYPLSPEPVEHRPIRVGSPVRSPLPPTGPNNLRLSEVAHKYFRERKVAPRTADAWKTAIKRFTDYILGDIGVRSITRRHVIDFKSYLLETKSRRGGRLSPASINKELAALKTILNFALDNDLCETNPTQGVRVKFNKHANKGHPFSQEDLDKIFGSDWFSEAPKDPTKRPERFWVTLLCLYQGRRISEVTQRLVTDVGAQDGIPFIRIVPENADQSVKNDASANKVPLHPELIRLGFLDYVTALKRKKAVRLFPGAKSKSKSRANRDSDPISKNFAYLLRRRLKITHKKKTLHSLRHTWTDRAKDCLIPEQIAEELLGHKGYYGRGAALSTLGNEIKKLSYEIDLSPLYVK